LATANSEPIGTYDGLHGWKAPITATSSAWTVTLIAFCSGGLAPLLLALYLGVWLYRLSGQKLSFILYGLITIFTILALVPFPRVHHYTYSDNAGTTIALLWVVSGFVLRAELLSYYKRTFGMHIELSWWKTLLFSTSYLNWCLAVYRP
jgi:hypothetical protein